MKKDEEERKIKEHLDSLSGDEWLQEIEKIEQERNERKNRRKMPELNRKKSESNQKNQKADQAKSEPRRDDSDADQRQSESRQTRSELRQSKSESRQTRSELHQTGSESRQTRSELRQSRSESRQGRPESGQERSGSRKRKSDSRRKNQGSVWQKILVIVVAVAFVAGVLAASFVISDAIVNKSKTNAEEGTAVESGESTDGSASGSEASATEETLVEGTSGDDVRLIMVGDVMVHSNVERLAEKSDDTYDYSFLFQNMKSTIHAADIALVNQEVIIGGSDLGISGYPKFNASFELADNLVDAGFDVVLQGSNHAGDKGEKGILSCISNWKLKYPNIPVLGIYDSQESADTICVVEEKGIKIAILNYTQSLNHSVSKSKSYLVSRLSEKQVRSDIQEAKTMADFVVVCPHWGTEYKNDTDAKQEKWAKIFLEEGVDLVIGTHPHVLEKIETLTDEDTGHSMLVYYSIGNFCSWISETGTDIQKREIGSMADVTIGKMDDGSIGIKSYGIEPLICHIASDKNSMTVYPYEAYSDDLAAQHLIVAYNQEFSMSYIDEYCKSIWGNLWNG